MPYIADENRKLIEIGCRPSTAGELNYILTMVCQAYLIDQANGRKEKGPRYADYNEVIGALECCKLELYRRQIAPYEDKAIKKNGDVWL